MADACGSAEFDPAPATEDACIDSESDRPSKTMLEHPVFVHWCESCGLESQEDAHRCPRCVGVVRRYQRVQELPDEDTGALSLTSLRAALADVLAGEDMGASAALLSEQGPDPGIAASHPTLASDLAGLGVPPAVQRALVSRGFVSLEQITAAAASAASSEGTLAGHFGLSPAAEVLLRRLWHVAAERRSDSRRAKLRRRAAAAASAERWLVDGSASESGEEASEGPLRLRDLKRPAAIKRLRLRRSASSLLDDDDEEEMSDEQASDSTLRQGRPLDCQMESCDEAQ